MKPEREFTFRGRPSLKVVKQPLSIFREAIHKASTSGIRGRVHDDLDEAVSTFGLTRACPTTTQWLLETDHSLRERCMAVIKGTAAPQPKLSRWQPVRRWFWRLWREWRATK